MPSLFDPLKLGDLTIPNRIIMAPLTRARAGESRVPNELMVEHYVQRATAGLIISEATSVTPMGVGYADTPGIWSGNELHKPKHSLMCKPTKITTSSNIQAMDNTCRCCHIPTFWIPPSRLWLTVAVLTY